MSTEGGVQNAPLNAKELGARAFALFTKPPQRWAGRKLDTKTIDDFHKNMRDSGYLPEHVLPHDGYLINIGNPDKEKRRKSLESLVFELTRCRELGLVNLNIHPGSHLRQVSENQCLDFIAECINRSHGETEGVAVVLENTAGQGSNVGYCFEHLAYIIDRVEDKSRIGVCLDTCHTYAAGYDIKTKSGYARTMKEFGAVVGFEYLRGAHLNDAKSELASRVDRHESIGMGTLGKEPFRFVMNDPGFDELPLILETVDDSLWPGEIRLLYRLAAKP